MSGKSLQCKNFKTVGNYWTIPRELKDEKIISGAGDNNFGSRQKLIQGAGNKGGHLARELGVHPPLQSLIGVDPMG